MVWQAWEKQSVKSDLAIYINMLGVPGQYKSVAWMLGYKLDFSSVNKDGFRRDSHKRVCKVVACTLNAYEKLNSVDYLRM